jgi:phosphoribosylaminoimidazole-succinocarboxamide synthase
LAQYQAGINPPSYDKQFLRDWLESVQVDGAAWNKRAPAPAIPVKIITETALRYADSYIKISAEKHN